ncbi:MAG: type II toxin-antitoxin system RelE/ParE family toxin [Bacteroidota bacterium]
MIVEFSKKFDKDLDKLNHKPTIKKVLKAIDEVEKAETIHQISNLKKLKGFEDTYRIRVGTYRIGLFVDVESQQAFFARILHRKDIYRFFP